MKYRIFALCLSLLVNSPIAMCNPVQPDSKSTVTLPPLAVVDAPPDKEIEIRNAPQTAVIMALVKTHRHPRSWKTLKFIPGKEFRYFYSCINAEGQEFTKALPVKYAGGQAFRVPDDRPFGEKHPNVHAVTGVLNLLGAPATAVIVGVKKQ